MNSFHTNYQFNRNVMFTYNSFRMQPTSPGFYYPDSTVNHQFYNYGCQHNYQTNTSLYSPHANVNQALTKSGNTGNNANSNHFEHSTDQQVKRGLSFNERSQSHVSPNNPVQENTEPSISATPQRESQSQNNNNNNWLLPDTFRASRRSSSLHERFSMINYQQRVTQLNPARLFNFKTIGSKFSSLSNRLRWTCRGHGRTIGKAIGIYFEA